MALSVPLLGPPRSSAMKLQRSAFLYSNLVAFRSYFDFENYQNPDFSGRLAFNRERDTISLKFMKNGKEMSEHRRPLLLSAGRARNAGG